MLQNIRHLLFSCHVAAHDELRNHQTDFYIVCFDGVPKEELHHA